MAHRKGALVLVAASALLATMAQAQWTSVDLHPAGATSSGSQGVGSGIVGGNRDLAYGSVSGLASGRALLWTGGVPADITPSFSAAAVVFCNNGNAQGGEAEIGWKGTAVMWFGSAGSCVNLETNKKATDSAVFAIYPGVQVGYVSTDPNVNVFHATMWSGTARSAVDLNPGGTFWSEGTIARGVFGTTIVGSAASSNYVAAHACRWNSSRNTFKDIHPAGFDGSVAFGVYGSEAVGFAYDVDPLTGAFINQQAQLWNISFGTSVSIHPAGWAQSLAFAVAPGAAVGRVRDAAGVSHAYYWNLYTNVNVDLSTMLTAGAYVSSTATAVYVNGNHIEVCGQAIDAVSGQLHAILWVYDPPV